MDITAIVNGVTDGLTIDGVISYDGIKEVIAKLNDIRKDAKVLNETLAKEQKKVNEEIANEKGREYASSLKEGDRVRFISGKNTIEATVGKQKDGAKTLHIVLDEIPEGTKSADRYVKYSKLVF